MLTSLFAGRAPSATLSSRICRCKLPAGRHPPTGLRPPRLRSTALPPEWPPQDCHGRAQGAHSRPGSQARGGGGGRGSGALQGQRGGRWEQEQPGSLLQCKAGLWEGGCWGVGWGGRVCGLHICSLVPRTEAHTQLGKCPPSLGPWPWP